MIALALTDTKGQVMLASAELLSWIAKNVYDLREGFREFQLGRLIYQKPEGEW